MSKRGAMQATLVHLLVVLSLVIESEQAPRCLGGRSQEWLWEKLNSGLLDADQVLRYMKKISGPSRTAIGETNVKELIQLSRIAREDCDDDTYKERDEICLKAEAAHNYNVNRYCGDQLRKLIHFCPEHAPDYKGVRINPPPSPATVEYFRSLFKDFGSKFLDEQEILKLAHEYINIYTMDTKKRDEAKRNCLALRTNRKQSGVIHPPSEQSDGSQSEADSGGPYWDNAYLFCKILANPLGY